MLTGVKNVYSSTAVISPQQQKKHYSSCLSSILFETAVLVVSGYE